MLSLHSSPDRSASTTGSTERTFGRYVLIGVIAEGGFATVHLGRLTGPMGFARTVAIKKLHPAYAQDSAVLTMLVDEARLGARIQHPNVVATLDVVVRGKEMLLVLEYVHGAALVTLLRAAAEKKEQVPLPVAIAILAGALRGLHAAHTTCDEAGTPLEIVHRDLSPQNILVGVDGVARVADFGVAKARGRLSQTQSGVLKGKAAYMAPEQVHGEASLRSDLFSMSVVAWELISGQRLFRGATMNEVLGGVIAGKIRPLRDVRRDVPEAVAQIVHQGLERDVARRPASGLDMAKALEAAMAPASATDVGAWVRSFASESLLSRERLLATEMESGAEAIESTELLTRTLRLDEHEGARRTKRWALVGALAAVASIAVGVRFWAHAKAPDKTPTSGTAIAPSESSPVAESPVVGIAPSADMNPASPSSRPSTPVRRTTHANCSPPYVVDANGHLKYKRECFSR